MGSLKQTLVRNAVTALGQEVVVDALTMISPRLRRIRVRGDAIHRLSWSPGDKIKLHVGDGVMRSYTPARVDREAGTMELVVHLHGHGPASSWAQRVCCGEPAVFLGPMRSMPPTGREDLPWAVFMGDETAIGLAQALVESCGPGTEIIGAIELERDDLHAVDALGLPLHAVARDGAHGRSLLDWVAETWIPPGDGIVWLSGEAQAVLELRHALVKRGLSRQQLRIKPYWSARGPAHRKRLERTALVA